MAVASELGLDDPRLFINEVLRLDGNVSRRGELRILCPVHEQGVEEHKPSCDLNVYSGLWRCWSCGKSGDLVRLTRLVLGLEDREVALRMLRPDNPDSIRAALKGRIRGSLTALDGRQDGKPTWKPSVPSWGSWEAPRHDLLGERGFTSETLERWGVRWVTRQRLKREDGSSFAITKSHAIPVTYEDGQVKTWCFRASAESEKWQPKYLYLPGVDIENLLFGRLHHHVGSTQVVGVTEGALDSMYLDQCGMPSLAILGASACTESNLNYLANFRKAVLVCDRDLAGSAMADSVGSALVDRGVSVVVCLWRPWMRGRQGKQAKDANDLPPVDVELLWETAIPWPQWRLRQRN